MREHGERIQYVGNANVLKNLVVNVQLKISINYRDLTLSAFSSCILNKFRISSSITIYSTYYEYILLGCLQFELTYSMFPYYSSRT